MTSKANSSAYYLIRDILSSYPNKVEENLTLSLYRHKLVKDNLLRLLQEEVRQQSPSYRLLSGILIVLFNYLRGLPNSAFFEVIAIIDELKYCFFKDKRKVVKRLSAQVILSLFLTLYFEFRMMPLHNTEDEEYVTNFTKVFNPDDLLNVIQETDSHYITSFLFQHFGFKLGSGREKEDTIKRMLQEFWS